MNNPLGASWTVRLSGLLGGAMIALWPIAKSALDTQMNGVKIDWNSVITGAVVALIGYLAKAHNVSNSPTPLAVAQPIVLMPSAAASTAAGVLAQPVPTIPPHTNDLPK
jgi:hypothetical protein